MLWLRLFSKRARDTGGPVMSPDCLRPDFRITFHYLVNVFTRQGIPERTAERMAVCWASLMQKEIDHELEELESKK